ncbi:LytR/AlgR family response regulator transcription factor [Roseivirga seohaensis]|uniref:LytR/AlgR family response regulator transcription factor n=1 Tax=Roseivirga seohaensis TaxID=1914963 RepID=UPI003BACB53B
MKVVFQLTPGKNLDEIKAFFKDLENKGEVELINVSDLSEGSVRMEYESFEYSFSSNLNYEEDNGKVLVEAIFVPDRHSHIRIEKQDIYFVEADGSYIKVFTKSRKFHLSSNLKSFSLQLNDSSFIRVSRKHLINSRHLHKINGNVLHVGPYDVLLSKNQRKNILDRFPILHTKTQTSL